MLEHMLDEKDDTQMKLDLLDELLALVEKRRGERLPPAKTEEEIVLPPKEMSLDIAVEDVKDDEDEV